MGICEGSAKASPNESCAVLLMHLTVAFGNANGKELFFSALFKLHDVFF